MAFILQLRRLSFRWLSACGELAEAKPKPSQFVSKFYSEISKTGAVSIVGHSPSKGKDYFPLDIVSFPSPIVSLGKEKVSRLSEILTIFSGIYPLSRRRASPAKRNETFLSPIVFKGSGILSICPRIRSKFPNRACTLSRTGTITKGGDYLSKGKECTAKGIDTIREDGDSIGEGIVSICDNGGGTGEDLVRIRVAGDRICVLTGGKGEAFVCIGVLEDGICRQGRTICEEGGGICAPFVSIGEPIRGHSEQKGGASE